MPENWLFGVVAEFCIKSSLVLLLEIEDYS